MSEFNRENISSHILETLENQKLNLQQQFEHSSHAIGYFFIDDILPTDLAEKIADSFPSLDKMNLKKSLREHKHVGAQMNEYHPLLEEVVYAFQDKRVVSVIADICKLKNIYPDENLYAGGISMMKQGNFLNPHLDNSHDKDRKLWRVLNLLYYTTPDWKLEYGGNLELWPKGVKEEPITVASRFNRLVVMTTHKNSWHSVSKVEIDAVRSCVSNYYFSDRSIEDSDYFHVTTFRGRPGQYVKDKILKLDAGLRMGIRKLFKKEYEKTLTYIKRRNNNDQHFF